MLPRRRRMLLLQRTGRIAPELPVHAIRPFRANNTRQIPYSIDDLLELPRLQPRILPQATEVIVHVPAGKTRQPGPRERPDKLLCRMGR
jgi:hypothetical protein